MNEVRVPQLPKYWQLAESFREQMQSGVLCPGDRLPSLAEMREQQGVSRATVDKVHSILEQDGLIERRPGYGTFVLEPKKALAKGIIGLCGWGFQGATSSAYWMQIMEGICQRAQAAETQVLLLGTSMGEGWEKADGVIVSDVYNPYYRQVVPAQMPLVYLFGLQPKRAGVAADEYSGVRLATQHLLELGHERIAYLHGYNEPLVPQRIKGYEDALHEAGVQPSKNRLRLLTGKNDSGPQFLSSGRRDMKAWLEDTGEKGWRELGCTALLCHNDDTAIGAMQALNEAGLQVPGDVSVVGFDGTDIGEYSSPRLTSIEMPLLEIGKVAVELLQHQVEFEEVSDEQKTLPTQLRVRQSTAAPSRR